MLCLSNFQQLHSPYLTETWMCFGFQQMNQCMHLCQSLALSHYYLMCHVSCVMCHVSCVMCHLSCAMCHASRVMRHRVCVTRSLYLFAKIFLLPLLLLLSDCSLLIVDFSPKAVPYMISLCSNHPLLDLMVAGARVSVQCRHALMCWDLHTAVFTLRSGPCDNKLTAQKVKQARLL